MAPTFALASGQATRRKPPVRPHVGARPRARAPVGVGLRPGARAGRGAGVGWLRAGDVESPRGHGAVVLGFLRAAAGWASRLPRLWRAGGACRPDQGVRYAQLERSWRRTTSRWEEA